MRKISNSYMTRALKANDRRYRKILVGLGHAMPEAGKAKPTAEQEEIDRLRARAERLGIKVDGRWGAARLQEEIAAAK
jgi:hypothetical protein